MSMRELKIFQSLVCIAFAGTVVAGCGPDMEIVPDQQDKILSYLDGKSLEYENIDGVYRYIANPERGGRALAPVVSEGDSVNFLFAAYTFVNAPQDLFYTNFDFIIEKDTVLNPLFWPEVPQRVKVGATRLLEGITRGLPGVCEGDSVQLFLTSDLAYGSKMVGSVPKDCAVVYYINVISVKKQ